MDEKDLQRLLERYLDGRANAEEVRMAEAFFGSYQKEAENEGYQNIVGDSEQLKKELLQSIYAKHKARQQRQRWLMTWRVAASVLLIALVGYGSFIGYEKIQDQKFALTEIHSADRIHKVLLSDGSVVWLKPNSSLIYPENFREEGERIVELEGEALFEVEKNPAQPFIVRSGDLTTTVLGTSFNIRTTGEQIEVVVLTGKVSITSTTDKQGIVVMPEEKVVYDGVKKALAKVETPVKQPVTEAIVSGTEYNMSFNDTRMADVIRRIEGKFNVKVSLSDPNLANCMITADFTGQSLVRTFNMIALTLGAEFEIKGDKVKLTGTGCN